MLSDGAMLCSRAGTVIQSRVENGRFSKQLHTTHFSIREKDAKSMCPFLAYYSSALPWSDQS